MAGIEKIYVGKATNTKTYTDLDRAIIAVLSREADIAFAPDNYVIASNPDIEPELSSRHLLTSLDKPLGKPLEDVCPLKEDITSYINEIRQILAPLTDPARIIEDRLARINEITTNIDTDEKERMRILKVVQRLSKIVDYNTDDIAVQKEDVELILRLPSESYVWSEHLGLDETKLIQTEDKGLIRLKYIPFEGLDSDLILVGSLVPQGDMYKIDVLCMKTKFT